MKKVLPIAALLLVASAAALIFTFSRTGGSRISATALAPAESVLFVHLPDFRQSAIRWPRTALAQIGNEPEVQAFLERPRRGLPFLAELNARMDQVTSVAPREAFVAVASIAPSGNPRVIGGFSFSGSESAVNEVLKEARAAIQKNRPAGKADLVSYAGVEIETYTDKEFVLAQVIHDQWCLVSNDVELLQATIDRLDGKPGAGAALTAGELYKDAVTPLPADPDAVVFGRLDSLADTLVPLLAAAGQTANQRQLETLQKTKAFGAAFKMDGEQLRDSVFLIGAAESAGKVMPRRGLGMSTPETVLFYASNIPEKMDVPAGSMAPLAMVAPGLSAMEQALQEKGLSFADFGKIFGPEMTFLLDWPAEAAQPALVVGFDVRDATRARGFLETVTSTPEGWTRQEQGEAVIYSSPMLGMIPGPVLALAGDFMVAGFSQPDVAAGIDRLKSKKDSLAQSEAYKAIVGQVSPPTDAFGYLDTARFFERSYGLVRPFLGMALALSPDSGKYIDAGKLPSAEAITRHLTPSVYSETVSEKGTLIESAGTLTFNQAIGGAVVAGVAAALPTLQATLKSAPALQGIMAPAGNQSSPTLPGTKSAPPASPAPSIPEGE